jgi:hypothetical protein
MPIDQLQSLMMNESFKAEIDSYYYYYHIEYSMSGIRDWCSNERIKNKYFEVSRSRYLKGSDYECVSNYPSTNYYSIEQFEKLLEKVQKEIEKTHQDYNFKVYEVNEKTVANKIDPPIWG